MLKIIITCRQKIKIMRFHSLIFLFFLIPISDSKAQTYPDYFGLGNDIGVTASSSPSQMNDSIQSTLNGTGYLTDIAEAYRFMAQAGFGGTPEDIDSVLTLGVRKWIDWQIEMPYTTYKTKYYAVMDSIIADIEAEKATIPGDTILTIPYKMYYYMSFAFWDKALTEKDMLRQKAAFALSQIFVVSYQDNFTKFKGDAFATYYDILYQGAFGNYRDMLYNIALNPLMGSYLSHFQNKKSDGNSEPDENFAREIMQLFSIGLIELNNDGTPKLDNNGKVIPTYDIGDIQEMAKVFTGLIGGAFESGAELHFTGNKSQYDFTIPMIRFVSSDGLTDWHETSEKNILGNTIPANQAGLKDIDDAIDILFNHPNVGPFISYRLIQHLVKSNPTPGYVNRVASAFNNDGNGVRGDMGAVFKAILLDPEARDCEWINHPRSGKLLQPIERFFNLFKAFDISSPSGKLRFMDFHGNSGEAPYIYQGFLNAPSVFNFFSPFYAESKFVAPNNMVSPEFQILNSVSSLHYLNRISEAINRLGSHGIWPSTYFQYHYGSFQNYTGITVNTNYNPDVRTAYTKASDAPFLDYSQEVNFCLNGNYEMLIDHLDLVLCRGQLNPEIKAHILQHIETIQNNSLTNPSENPYPNENPCGNVISNNIEYNGDDNNHRSIVKDIIYFIMMSPSYTILK